MNTTDLYFSDAYLKHQVHLLRFTSSEQAKVDALFRAMVPELKNKLNNGLTDFSKRRVNAVLKQTEEVIDRYYGMMGGKAKKYPWEIIEKVTGSYKGQTNAALIAQNESGALAKLEYAQTGDRILIQYIDVPEVNRRNKLGTSLVERLKADNPGATIEWGSLTDKGAKLKASIDVTPQAIDYAGLAKTEADFTAKTFTSIGLEASLPSEATLKALVNGSLIEGAPSAKWWAKQSDDLAFKFSNQVRQGVAQNETVQQIVRRVAGSKRLGIPGIMDVSRRNASALVHTSIQQVAADAKLATFKANADVVKGTRFLATFDSHTSAQCIAHSGAEWDLEGNAIKGGFPFEPPPLHFNCRSTLVPITLTFKELGIDVPEVKGTRASDLGQVKSDLSFDGFLKRHSTEYQDDLLGPGKAALWREKKITLTDLMGQSGRPLSLDALKGK